MFLRLQLNLRHSSHVSVFAVTARIFYTFRLTINATRDHEPLASATSIKLSGLALRDREDPINSPLERADAECLTYTDHKDFLTCFGLCRGHDV
jgi:hypothetical protein